MDREQVLADLKEWLKSDPDGTGQVYINDTLAQIEWLEEEYE